MLPIFLAPGILAATGWCTLAIYYSNLPGTWRPWLAIAFAIAVVGVFAAVRPMRKAFLVFIAAFACVMTWWMLAIPPSNLRNWKPEVAVLSTATVDGDEVMIRNIRNFDYRTETDFTARYYDKTFRLSQLDSVDLICVYWGSPAIAHVMVSFGFSNSDYVAFSIETRPEQGEGYSTLKGFFRQMELYYVVADERDVIGVRTNHRKPEEQVYLYRTRMPLEVQRRLFLDYVRELNELAAQPQWYNTLTDNCTTGVLLHSRMSGGRARYHWKVLLSGYAAEYAYESGILNTTLPFEELRRRSLVNDRAHRALGDTTFSQKIREGTPEARLLTMEEFLNR